MEVGKLATFAGEDGKPKSVLITDQHVSALMNHAGNRAIPSHWSHDWAESDKDPLHMRVGMLNAFRLDDEGNLIGDLHLSPGEHREKALWSAEHEPGNIMLSAVFNYSKADAKCIPRDFQACDLVSKGAAVTALLEESKPASMDIQELLTALDDPAVKAAVKAILKSHTGPEEDAAADSAESDAGVSDADKKKDDDQQPALMRAVGRITRAFKRQLGEAVAAQPDKTALLAEVKTAAAAEATALLGKGGFIGIGGDGQSGDEYEKALAKCTADAGGNAVKGGAILMREYPHLMHEYGRRQELRVAKLRNANPVS